MAKRNAQDKKLFWKHGCKTYPQIRRKNGAGAEIVALIQEVENAAHREGFHVTAHALNNAKNACGWERAGDVVMAGKAARGERPGSRIAERFYREKRQ